ncbi:sigma-70 family RNA polymerase sigma factor [Roseiconus nitratireducens]|uniref:Sigma-70 family RNA polymerase sigma factor n=1 Tax=Roseiconus nitratireducens TaxID=2605748 RepID=A0A5M6CQF2_9BACT|nr:sigma-70 family RNA polymerase sigma factor [Roseiconus nitratireducens]KAA5537548.1 sigma-70 family RNA polymerase sigma factor [Roseiconus nitratireducens]
MRPEVSSDEQAEFVALLTASQGAIALTIRALMPGERQVEEVVQQTNAKLWQKRGDFQRGTNFRAWASAIARYEVLNFRKQQARDARLTFSDELTRCIADEVPQMQDDLSDQQLALRKCLGELKTESRDLLLSRYRGDESISQLSARLGRSVGGLRVTLSRLRTALLRCIQRRLDSAEGLA